MHWIFLILAMFAVGGALAAVLLPTLVHSALCLSVAFAGMAALYLQLGAEFVGFAQIMVYVGAVAILIVMAILLTRGGDVLRVQIGAASWMTGIAVTAMIGGIMIVCVLSTPLPSSPAAPATAPVKEIGKMLMTRDVLALETVGMLLTAAMIGAAAIALPKRRNR